MSPSFYSNQEIETLGFASCGKQVFISRKASLYGTERITLGSNVRIDDYCVISAGSDGLAIGSYVHIAVFCSLIGSARIELKDFAGLSSRVAIYSSTEDFSGTHLTN